MLTQQHHTAAPRSPAWLAASAISCQATAPLSSNVLLLTVLLGCPWPYCFCFCAFTADLFVSQGASLLRQPPHFSEVRRLVFWAGCSVEFARTSSEPSARKTAASLTLVCCCCPLSSYFTRQSGMLCVSPSSGDLSPPLATANHLPVLKLKTHPPPPLLRMLSSPTTASSTDQHPDQPSSAKAQQHGVQHQHLSVTAAEFVPGARVVV